MKSAHSSIYPVSRIGSGNYFTNRLVIKIFSDIFNPGILCKDHPDTHPHKKINIEMITYLLMLALLYVTEVSVYNFLLK